MVLNEGTPAVELSVAALSGKKGGSTKSKGRRAQSQQSQEVDVDCQYPIHSHSLLKLLDELEPDEINSLPGLLLKFIKLSAYSSRVMGDEVKQIRLEKVQVY